MTLLTKNPDGVINLQTSVAALDKAVESQDARIAALEAELKKIAGIAAEVDSATDNAGEGGTQGETAPAA